MAIIELHMPNPTNTNPLITVIGVGGAGGNVVNNMIAAGLGDVQFVVANTDKQALAASKAERCIQLGTSLTEGLGAGSDPEVGEAAAEEAADEIRAALAGSHMLFIAAGMGGGTGTGAAYVIAREARELDILTIAVVTKPFQFEGSMRLRNAEAGIAELRKYADTLLVIPNENLFRVANDKTTFADAFVMADQVMYSGIVSITDLIVKEGLINLDLADVRTVLSGMGRAMLGMGEAAGEQRAALAAEEAIVNPLLDEVTLKGAKSLLLCITGGRDLTLWEVEEAASRVCQEVDPDANIIVGATFDEGLGDRIRVSIVASGMPRLSVEAPGRGSEGPAWTPRAQREADSTAHGDSFGRRLTEAIGETEPHARARPPQRSRPKDRRAPGEVEAKKDGPPKLPKQPAASRPRKPSAARKGALGAQARPPDLPVEMEDREEREESEIKRRVRRLPVVESPPAPRWPERSAPATNGAVHPMPELEASIVLRHEPQPLPRKTGFLERLGFGRVRREA
jgi:cell division protein FtsZ